MTHPDQLGRFPNKVAYVKTLRDRNKRECHIFKFKTQFLGRWMVGIVCDIGPFTDYREFKYETADQDALALIQKLGQEVRK